jgi:uncharacterized protein involved in cysteine biosynthesis
MRTRTLALVAATGPPLFLAISVLAGLIKPGYDVAQQTVSDLAVGAHGWIQAANFVLLGAALIAFALARRGPRTIPFAVAGAALVASAYFTGDLAGTAETSHGAVHNLLALVIFLALVTGLALNRAKLLAVAVFALLAVFVMFAGDIGDPLHSVAGLLERALIAVPLAWIAVSARQQLDPIAPRIGRVEAADAR